MGIVINLDVMMARRKKGLKELSAEVDITMANLSILKNNKAKAIRFSTLEAICKALDCQPGDILSYEQEEGEDENGREDVFDRNSPGGSKGHRGTGRGEIRRTSAADWKGVWFFRRSQHFLWCKRQLLPVSESSGDYSPFVCGGDLWGCISDIQKNGGAHQEGFLFAGSRIPFDWAFRLFYG